MSLVVSELGLLHFPDLSNPGLAIKVEMESGDRTKLIDRLAKLDSLMDQERDERRAQRKNDQADASCWRQLRQTLARWCCCSSDAQREKVKAQQEMRVEKAKRRIDPSFHLPSELPAYAHAVDAPDAADQDPRVAQMRDRVEKAQLGQPARYEEARQNESPYSDVTMHSISVAQAAALVIQAATKAGAKVSKQQLSAWTPRYWRRAYNQWFRRAFWGSTVSDWLEDAEHKDAHSWFSRLRTVAIVAVMGVEFYGFYQVSCCSLCGGQAAQSSAHALLLINVCAPSALDLYHP